MSDRRRADGSWTPISTTHRCERHLCLGDVHCGKRARWRHALGRILCGGCRQLVVRSEP